MEINKDDFLLAGKHNNELCYTDSQLENQVKVLELVLTYLNARGDCGIISCALGRDLLKFKAYQWARGIEKIQAGEI